MRLMDNPTSVTRCINNRRCMEWNLSREIHVFLSMIREPLHLKGSNQALSMDKKFTHGRATYLQRGHDPGYLPEAW